MGQDQTFPGESNPRPTEKYGGSLLTRLGVSKGFETLKDSLCLFVQEGVAGGLGVGHRAQ